MEAAGKHMFGQFSYNLLNIRATQFLISVSLLVSLFLCGFSLFANYSLPNVLLSRKYMFIVCNGILALLAKSSVVSNTSSGDYEPDGIGTQLPLELLVTGAATSTIDDDDEQIRSGTATVETSPEDVDNDLDAHGRGGSAPEEAIEENKLDGEREEEEMDESPRESIIQAEDRASSLDEAKTLEIEGREEEGDQGGDITEKEAGRVEDLASTEELNRRIEEFIRKMKEEIRIEAQQQLIAV